MPTHDMARFHKWIHRKPHLFEYAARLLAAGKHDVAWAQHYLGMRVGLRPQEIGPAMDEYQRMVAVGEVKLTVPPPKPKATEMHRTEPKVDKRVMVEGHEVAWDPKKGWVYLDGKKVPKKLAPEKPGK